MIDHKLTCLLHDQSGKKPWLDTLAIFCARDLAFVFVLLPVVLVLANAYFRYRTTLLGFWTVMIIGVVGVGWIMTQVVAYKLQFLFARRRPFQFEHLHPIYKARISSPSFPSGHATMVSYILTVVGVFIFSATLTTESLWFFWVMVGMGVLILIARVYGGLHYVSDILAGLILGSGMFFLFKSLFFLCYYYL